MHEQRTDEWLAMRAGKVTASRVFAILDKTAKGLPTAARASYIKEIVVERLTGQRKDIFVNKAMQRGVDLEPIARSEYEMSSGVLVMETGFILHPIIENVGASPDGLVGDDGLIEIKCPETWNHLEVMQTGEIPPQYIAQMQLQMECTGRGWCDFISYDDRLPPHLAYFQKRVEYDAAYCADMIGQIIEFLCEVDHFINKLPKPNVKKNQF